MQLRSRGGSKELANRCIESGEGFHYCVMKSNVWMNQLREKLFAFIIKLREKSLTGQKYFD